MKRIATWLLSTVSILVLLFGYHTSTSGATSASGPAGLTPTVSFSGANAGSGSGNGASSGAGSGSGNGNGNGNGAGTGTGATTATVTGDVAQTEWGPVQVQLTTSGSKITDVQVLQYPTGNSTDAEINSYALPILMKATMSAQSAQIDMVSGATVTSGGYLQSLQSALDQVAL